MCSWSGTSWIDKACDLGFDMGGICRLELSGCCEHLDKLQRRYYPCLVELVSENCITYNLEMNYNWCHHNYVCVQSSLTYLLMQKTFLKQCMCSKNITNVKRAQNKNQRDSFYVPEVCVLVEMFSLWCGRTPLCWILQCPQRTMETQGSIWKVNVNSSG